jgi:hypothetical protein
MAHDVHARDKPCDAIANRGFRTRSGYFSGAPTARGEIPAPVTKATRSDVSSGARRQPPRPKPSRPSPARGDTRRSPAPSHPPRPADAGTRCATRPSPRGRDGRSGPPIRGGRGSRRRGYRACRCQLFQQEALGCRPGGVGEPPSLIANGTRSPRTWPRRRASSTSPVPTPSRNVLGGWNAVSRVGNAGLAAPQPGR